jgi:hypothetical protein
MRADTPDLRYSHAQVSCGLQGGRPCGQVNMTAEEEKLALESIHNPPPRSALARSVSLQPRELGHFLKVPPSLTSPKNCNPQNDQVGRDCQCAGFCSPCAERLPSLPFLFDAKTIAAGMNFTLTTDLGDRDFLGEVSGLGSYKDVLASSEKKLSVESIAVYLALKGSSKPRKPPLVRVASTCFLNCGRLQN